MPDSGVIPHPEARWRRTETRRRTKLIGVRLTPDECTRLSLAAHAAGKTLPAYLRDAALALADRWEANVPP